MALFRRSQAVGTGGIALLAGAAWVSFTLGRTFHAAMTIMSFVVWTAAALVFVYLLLFRNVRITLFQGAQEDDAVEHPDAGSSVDEPRDVAEASAVAVPVSSTSTSTVRRSGSVDAGGEAGA